jgi:hypothetical protein
VTNADRACIITPNNHATYSGSSRDEKLMPTVVDGTDMSKLPFEVSSRSAEVDVIKS